MPRRVEVFRLGEDSLSTGKPFHCGLGVSCVVSNGGCVVAAAEVIFRSPVVSVIVQGRGNDAVTLHHYSVPVKSLGEQERVARAFRIGVKAAAVHLLKYDQRTVRVGPHKVFRPPQLIVSLPGSCTGKEKYC